MSGSTPATGGADPTEVEDMAAVTEGTMTAAEDFMVTETDVIPAAAASPREDPSTARSTTDS